MKHVHKQGPVPQCGDCAGSVRWDPKTGLMTWAETQAWNFVTVTFPEGDGVTSALCDQHRKQMWMMAKEKGLEVRVRPTL